MKYFKLCALGMLFSMMSCQPDGLMDGKTFLKAVEKIEKMDEARRWTAAEDLFRQVQDVGTPLYVNDTTAIIVAHTDEDSLLLLGDMNVWQAAPVFTRIPGTELQYFVGEYESNARLQYWFMNSPDAWPGTDSLNPNLVSNGFGKMSELAMPGYVYDPIFEPFRDGHLSTTDGLDEHMIPAGILPYEHLVHVWMPAGVSPEEIAGSIYLLDGLGYVTYAHIPTALAARIADGKIPPLMAVFVTPPNYEKAASPNRETEYGINPVFADFMADELVPYVESKYPIGRGPETRMVTGDSYGGLGAHYIGYQRSDVFGLAYSQSGYFSFLGDSLIKLYQDSEKLDLKLAFDIGTYETHVGGGYLNPDEADFTAANRRMEQTLKAKGYEYHYREYPEGHTWGNWRQHLIDILPWFYDVSQAAHKSLD